MHSFHPGPWFGCRSRHSARFLLSKLLAATKGASFLLCSSRMRSQEGKYLMSDFHWFYIAVAVYNPLLKPCASIDSEAGTPPFIKKQSLVRDIVWSLFGHSLLSENSWSDLSGWIRRWWRSYTFPFLLAFLLGNILGEWVLPVIIVVDDVFYSGSFTSPWPMPCLFFRLLEVCVSSIFQIYFDIVLLPSLDIFDISLTII